MRKSLLTAAAFGLLFSALPLRADFLLWIEKPKERTNPNDQKSKLFQPTVMAGTATFTPTITATRTNSPVNTATPTPSRTASPTATHTNPFTATPTSTASPTATPSLVLTATPTATPSPVLTATPTATPSLVLTATVTPTPPACAATYNFEAGVGAWAADNGYDCGATGVSAGSTANAYCGNGSLAGAVNFSHAVCGGGGSQEKALFGINMGSNQDLSCKTVSVWVYVPAGMSDASNPMGAYLYSKSASFAYNASTWVNLPNAGGWTQLTWDLSAAGAFAQTIQYIGVQFSLNPSAAPVAGTVYIDEFNVAGPTCGGSPTVTPTPGTCTGALYSFEGSAQGWVAGTGVSSVAPSTAYASCDAYSLAINLTLNAGNPQGAAQIDAPAIVNNDCKVLTAKLYVPAGMSGDATGVQFFAQTGAGWAWNDSWTNLPNAGGWVDLTLDLSGVSGVIQRVGVQINLGGPPPGPDYTGTLYLDEVRVTDKVGCGVGSPTVTPTPGTPPPSGSWPLIYDDSTGGVTNAFAAGDANGGITEVGTGGDPGSYAHVTITALAYVGAAVFHNGFSAPNVPILESATPLSSVALSLRVPASGGNCYPPAVGLRVFPGGGATGYNTKKVAVRNYLVGSTDLSLKDDQWYQVSIPLSAFLGYNAQPAPDDLTITAGDLDYVHGVYVEPYSYGVDTNFTGAIDVDNIRLTYTTPNPVLTTVNSMAADFEYGDGQGVWGAYWSANIDAFTCSAVNTALTYPPSGQTSVVDVGGNTSGTGCHSGHLQGILGTANGGYEGGGTTCTDPPGPAGDFGYLNMSMNLDPLSTPASPIGKDISDASFIGNLPSGAQGMRIWLKRAPGVVNEAKVIKVFLERVGAKEGDQYMFLVLTSDIPTTEFKMFQVDFPWDASISSGISTGAYPPPAGNATAPGAGGTESHTDAGEPAIGDAMASSELWWGQPWYFGNRVSWSRTDVFQLGVGAIQRGRAVDVYVDDIEFY